MEKLSATVRDKTGKEFAIKLRHKGYVPGVVYGKGISNIHIFFELGAFEKVIHHTGKNRVFKLELDNGNSYNVIIKDVQIHPTKRIPIHVDFIAVNPEDEVVVEVPVEFVGIPKGVRVGGFIRRGVWSLKIKTKVKDIPEVIRIDISSLDVGDVLAVYKVRETLPYKIVAHENTFLVGVYKS